MDILKIDDVQFILRCFVKDNHDGFVSSIMDFLFKLSVILSEYLTRFLLFWFL